jgi:deoxyadenosine/deoxycytidine kinase
MDIVFSIICIVGFIYFYKSAVKLKSTFNRQIFLLNERVDNLSRHFSSVEEFGKDNFNIVTDVLHTHELMIDKLEQKSYHNRNYLSNNTEGE